MRTRILALAGIALLALTGCKSSLAETTDEQLVQLLSGGGFFTFSNGGEDQGPPQITRRILECIEVLSGSRAEIYKDMPEELSGMMKTDCRKDLQGRLDDPKRNTTELELSDFESAETMERVNVLQAKQAAALQAYRAEQEEARTDSRD